MSSGYASLITRYPRHIVRLEEGGDRQIHTIWVLFRGHSDPVAITRQICDSYKLDNGDIIELFQFPLTLAWATTAHKAQGQTLEKVAINIREDAFAHGAFYVALSRVRRLDDLMLFGTETWPIGGPIIHVNQFIRDEMDRVHGNLHLSQES